MDVDWVRVTEKNFLPEGLPRGRLVLQGGMVAPAPALGRCQHPVPGRQVGHLVNRVETVQCATQLEDPRIVGDVIDEVGDGFAGAPWQVGDVVDVHPITTPATRCGRCLPCRAAAAVAWCRRVARPRRSRGRVTSTVLTLARRVVP